MNYWTFGMIISVVAIVIVAVVLLIHKRLAIKHDDSDYREYWSGEEAYTDEKDWPPAAA